ncbi:hypothetical protein D3C86_2034250 [compost metagenome]
MTASSTSWRCSAAMRWASISPVSAANSWLRADTASIAAVPSEKYDLASIVMPLEPSMLTLSVR